jgi:NAD(P)-dependent dehydrogenase (short-subunit alcohol dehydrogenase family)
MSKSILITGASSGIGRACALHFDKAGWRVFAGVRTEAAAQSLAAEASLRLTPLRFDVTDKASLATVDEALGEGELDALLNNAGIYTVGPLELLPVDELRNAFEVNVIGHLAITQAVLPRLRAAKGRIVNLGSAGGRVSVPFAGAYSATKFALAAMTDALRCELRTWGIAVCHVEPGAVETPLWEKAARSLDDWTARLPPEKLALYRQAIAASDAMRERSRKQASPMKNVVAAVEHAVTSPKPKPNYVVGLDAKVAGLMARFVPRELLDAMLTRPLAT